MGLCESGCGVVVDFRFDVNPHRINAASVLEEFVSWCIVRLFRSEVEVCILCGAAGVAPAS